MKQRVQRILAAAWAAAFLPSVGFASVYSELMAEFSRFDHRLPGSTNLEVCLSAVEAKLRSAGLEPHRQTYDTLVPRTTKCVVRVGNRELAPIHPVNNGVAPFITPHPITGPLLWLGDGRISSLTGREVRGCVALLDLDSPDLEIEHVFTFGARAVIFVGGATARQWNVARIAQEGPVTVPRLFVDARTAEAFGLRRAEGQEVSIDVNVTLVDVPAQNLWVEIPGEKGAQFLLGREEAVVLSATLDTVGLVPDYCPETRAAANAALLAETVCALAAQPHPRAVFAVFFGSHYAAQEGARVFFYPVSQAEKGGLKIPLDERHARFQDEIRNVERLRNASDRTDLFASRDPDAEDLTKTIKLKLVGWVNNLNADIRVERLAADDARKKLAKAAKPTTPEEEARQAAWRADAERRDLQALQLEADKAAWNGLRQSIMKGQSPADEAGRAAYERVLASVRQDLDQRRNELGRSVNHSRSAMELAERFQDKAVVAHLDFDFANGRDPWIFSMIDSFELFASKRPDVGSYVPNLAGIGKAYAHVPRTEGAPRLFTDALSPFYKPFSLSVPGQRSTPSAVGMLLGIAGYQMMTLGDPLDADHLPVRVPVDLSGLIPEMKAVVDAFASRPELSVRSPFKRAKQQERLIYCYKKGDDYEGTRFMTVSKGSADTEGPALNALAILKPYDEPYRLAGISRCPVARINTDGFVFMPMLNQVTSESGDKVPVLYAFGYRPDGSLDRCVVDADSKGVSRTRVNLFYAHGGGPFSYGFAPDLLGSEQLYGRERTLNAKTDSAPRQYCAVKLSSLQPFYSDREGSIKRIGTKGELLLGSTPEKPTGVGIPLDREFLLSFDGIRQSAHDYRILNESRLAALRSRNIVNDALEALHAEAQDHLDTAEESLRRKDYGFARAHHIFASCLENRVYAPLRGITDDLVKAVVVLLLLNIPFAFALERLICGFTSIFKQVIGFAVFFVGTFFVLFFTHPAFSLASAPIIIFLAFVIILLGVITLCIVLGKIRQEIRAIQGLASTVHGVESDSSTALAAVMIGISGMRNRPLKTFLTAITVVLLTFTILVFASFTSRLGVLETYLGKGQGEDRVELHRFSHLDIPENFVEAIATVYGKDYQVFQRGGLFRNPTRSFDKGITPMSPDRVVYNPANGKVAGLGAVLGVEAGELAVSPRLAAIVPGFTDPGRAHPPLYLPASIAAKLEVKVGDPLLMIGRSYTYAGSPVSSALQAYATIDDARAVPPDFESIIKKMGKDADEGADASSLEQMDVSGFEWFSPERVGVTDLAVLRRNYPACTYTTFVTLYPRSGDQDVEKTARELAPVFQGAVHAKSGEGARKFFFTRAVAGSGFSDVIVPLLLGGLIIFSSLMGSIVDREREIFTYSALGLSPPSVGALFFAESAVYSVVGGMGGYLVSQVVAKVLNVLGSRGFLHPPEMNFSSLSSVLTILIVMAVVMLSTIYPAIKAGRSANPGVARKWRMPAAVGDHLRFVFPFTVSEVDFAGILSFIREHFENHSDATLGNFAARDVHLFSEPGGGGRASLGIRAEVSLAPFDLGIFQRFRMYSKEFEIKGIDEVVVEVERVGGTPASWTRSNRAFADELRQQFLLWRSLPISTVEHYRKMTEEALASIRDGKRTPDR
jgi:hypothetical protein